MAKDAGPKIRIRQKAYDHHLVDQSARKIVETAIRAKGGAARDAAQEVTGPVPLPTEMHRVCVIRSPHKYKDSREHFEMRIHKRLVDIHNPDRKTVESLQRLDLPAGVDVELKIM